jgi:RNA polymerase sigma-70 factor (family 1)
MANCSTLSDLELVELLKSSDHGAFNELFERYGVILYTFTYKKVRDKESAKDLVQSVYTDLWQKRSSINIKGEFRAYLFTILKNRILNEFRHQKVSQRFVDNFQAYINDAEDNTDHLVRYNDFSLLIEQEIQALPEKMRIVFKLSKDDAMTRKEIAAILNLSEEAVKSRMHRAMIILKGRLGILYLLILINFS